MTVISAHSVKLQTGVYAITEESVPETPIRPDLFRALLERFGELGGVELDLPDRSTAPRDGTGVVVLDPRQT